ncbi:MAG: ABC transporter permease [Coriobacteriales bacterium]|nr:ABC transporter permease [Coriobacteriales bacterium]
MSNTQVPDAHAMLDEELASQIGESETIRDLLGRMVRENHLAAASALVILLFGLAAICAGLLAPYDPNEVRLDQALMAPCAEHLLGTDDAGRDVLSRLLFGSRISLLVGIVPTLVSMAIGAALGAVSGYFGGWIDTIIMRLADILLAFPSILLVMVIMYTLGDGLLNVFIALSMLNWAVVARVVRAETLHLEGTEYMEASRVIGVSHGASILRHILPNCLPILIVLFTLAIPGSILSESGLSFLGLGVQPPDASWGQMVNAGRQFLYYAPWISLAPSACIMLVVLAFNFLGDGLRDVLDPHLRNQ